MTRSSFGALMKYRRVKLGLSADQVAYQVERLGQHVDVDRLEEGLLPSPTPDQLHALATVLDWSPALLQVAISPPEPPPPRGPLHLVPIQVDPVDESLSAILTEVEGLRDLQTALREWTEDILDRLRDWEDPPVA